MSLTDKKPPGAIASYVTEVQVVDNSGVPIVSFGGDQQYTDAAVRGTATGTLAMGDDGTNIQSVKVDASGELQIDVLTLPALVAGTANIGDVDVLTIAAGDNNIGNVDIVSGVITTVSTVTNLSQMNGVAISLNTGARDAGTQRVTIATNDVVPVTDNGGSLTVDAPVDTPAFVRLSNGTSAIETLPVSIAEGAIASGALAPGSVASGAIASGAVASGAFASGSIAAGAIASGAIASGALAPGSVASGAFEGGAIAAGAIAAGAIALGAIASGALAPGSVASGAFEGGAIASGAVASGAFASGSIAEGAVAAGATSFVKLEDAASANTDAGVPAMAVRRATPVNTSGLDGDYEMLQISAGRLWTSATIDAALPTGANVIGALSANQSTNVAQMNGVAVTMGNGVDGTGVQRVTMASNSTGILAGVTTVTTLTGASIAHDGADSGNPHKMGGRATNVEIAAVSNNDRTDFVATLTGKQITQPYSNPENYVSGSITTAMTGTTTTSLVAAPGAGLRNYITTIIISNAHATVGTDVIIQDGSGGATLLIIPAAAVYGGAAITLPFPLRQPTANTALFCANFTTGASVKASAVGFRAA